MTLRTTGADLHRTVRRLTAGVTGSAVVAAAAVTGTLMHSSDQPTAGANPSEVTATSSDPNTPAETTGDSELQDDDNAAAPAASVAPIAPPTVARGGGHASSGGS